jgi:hypothetical protein
MASQLQTGHQPFNVQHTYLTTLHPGDGQTYPQKKSTIVCHYTGTLSNGEIFDSSREKETEFHAKLGAQNLVLKSGDIHKLNNLKNWPRCQKIKDKNL